MKRGIGIGVATSVFAAVLTGCTSVAAPVSTTSPTSQSPTPQQSVAAPPVFDPAGGAAANLAFFDLTNTTLLSSQPEADGRTIVDTLVAAGFDKSRMEVTPDRTAVDLKADSIQFSVRFDDGCLVGQSGEKTGYLSQKRAVLATGRCMVGETRAIDW